MIRRARSGSVFARRRQSRRAIWVLFSHGCPSRIIDELEHTLRFGRMLVRQRFSDRGVVGPAASGAADVPDEGQHPIGLDSRRGRQEIYRGNAESLVAPRPVPSLHGSAGGPSRPRRDSANLRRLVPARRAGFEVGPARATRGRVGLNCGELQEPALPISLLGPVGPRPTARKPMCAAPGSRSR